MQPELDWSRELAMLVDRSEAEIVRLYVEERLAMQAIADRLHAGHDRVQGVLKRHGVKMRRTNSGR